MNFPKVLFKRSSEENKVPNISDLDLGELALNSFDGKLFLKRDYVDEANTALQEIVQFVSKIPIRNCLYVQKDGNDRYEGDTWDRAFLTVEKALEVAETRNDITLIDIGPGTYITRGNLSMPDNTFIRTVHRSVKFQPEQGYEENNVFLMGSGCFIEGPLFENWRLDSLDNPTVGFAVSFRPGAIITRVPYAHKIAVRTNPYWEQVAPPLDRENANPLVGRGAGVALADGSVCSPYSIYPNIMTWGATPVTHNGIGYVAKNGGLINAVNAISIWAHKHFLAIDGGQIILSSCSTQFGDYTMVSQGKRQVVVPKELENLSPPVELNTATSNTEIEDYDTILAARETIVDNLWISLDQAGYVANTEFSGNNAVLNTAEDEIFTKKDANTLIQSFAWVIRSGNEKPALDFAKGLFDTQGNPVFSLDKLPAFLYSFEYIRDEINSLPSISSYTQGIITGLTEALIDTVQNPTKISEPSTITAIGHTWSGIFAGVALTKIPPARNQATIRETILELNDGIVIASGQDDQGSALFVGGMEINADTGELSGPPFNQAVNRIATRASISRSF